MLHSTTCNRTTLKKHTQIFTSIHNNYCLTQLYFAVATCFGCSYSHLQATWPEDGCTNSRNMSPRAKWSCVKLKIVVYWRKYLYMLLICYTFSAFPWKDWGIQREFLRVSSVQAVVQNLGLSLTKRVLPRSWPPSRLERCLRHGEKYCSKD